ncbi:MAG: sugar-binding domain-containing protein [Bacteroidota bacterium]
MAEVPLQTPWASEVNPKEVLPEYPRPIMQRERWLNLNGLWQFEPVEKGQAIRFGQNLEDQILVPYPWESALSGQRVQLDSRRARYRRSFDLPADWRKERLLLHFGAVDWEATVYLNGQFVGQHRGGYDAFSFDVSPYLSDGTTQELIVEVWDPGNDEPIAYGKQNNDRFGDPQRFAYSASSGIWQTVWLEPVGEVAIVDFHAEPDIDARRVTVSVDLNRNPGKRFMRAILSDSTQTVSTAAGNWLEPLVLDLPNPRLWTPQDPFLYPLTLEVVDSSGRVFDRVASYVGMRKISIAPNQYGAQMMLLNNRFLFQMGPLDQGYWPDGLYTAPTDEALRWEVAQIKAFGFNMVRKHIKIEPQRWS